MNWISTLFISTWLDFEVQEGWTSEKERGSWFIHPFSSHLWSRSHNVYAIFGHCVTVNINRCTCSACRRHFRLGVLFQTEVLTGARRCFHSRRCITRNNCPDLFYWSIVLCILSCHVTLSFGYRLAHNVISLMIVSTIYYIMETKEIRWKCLIMNMKKLFTYDTQRKECRFITQKYKLLFIVRK